MAIPLQKNFWFLVYKLTQLRISKPDIILKVVHPRHDCSNGSSEKLFTVDKNLFQLASAETEAK